MIVGVIGAELARSSIMYLGLYVAPGPYHIQPLRRDLGGKITVACD
jgi:hypothetical protein